MRPAFYSSLAVAIILPLLTTLAHPIASPDPGTGTVIVELIPADSASPPQNPNDTSPAESAQEAAPAKSPVPLPDEATLSDIADAISDYLEEDPAVITFPGPDGTAVHYSSDGEKLPYHPDDAPEESQKPPIGIIIGGVIGGLAGLCGIGAAVFLGIRMWKRKKAEKNATDSELPVYEEKAGLGYEVSDNYSTATLPVYSGASEKAGLKSDSGCDVDGAGSSSGAQASGKAEGEDDVVLDGKWRRE